jgi:hypothetical protein
MFVLEHRSSIDKVSYLLQVNANQINTYINCRATANRTSSINRPRNICTAIFFGAEGTKVESKTKQRSCALGNRSVASSRGGCTHQDLIQIRLSDTDTILLLRLHVGPCL